MTDNLYSYTPATYVPVIYGDIHIFYVDTKKYTILDEEFEDTTQEPIYGYVCAGTHTRQDIKPRTIPEGSEINYIVDAPMSGSHCWSNRAMRSFSCDYDRLWAYYFPGYYHMARSHTRESAAAINALYDHHCRYADLI